MSEADKPAISPAGSGNASAPAGPPKPLAPKAPPRPPKLKAFVETDNCTGCEICIQFCPVEQCIVKAPDINEGQLNGYVRVVESKCIGCRLCVRECPWDAISMVMPGSMLAMNAPLI